MFPQLKAKKLSMTANNASQPLLKINISASKILVFVQNQEDTNQSWLYLRKMTEVVETFSNSNQIFSKHDCVYVFKPDERGCKCCVQLLWEKCRHRHRHLPRQSLGEKLAYKRPPFECGETKIKA